MLLYALTSVMSPSLTSLPFLYLETLGKECAQLKFPPPPCYHIPLSYIIGFDIKTIHHII